jgi:hypothetical protein
LAAISVDSQPIEVFIDKVPKYESLAPKFKQMHDNGASIQTIAAAHQMSWQELLLRLFRRLPVL